MRAKREIVYKLELSESEFNAVKECLNVFVDDNLNEHVKGQTGIRKLSSDQLIDINELNTYLDNIG